MFILGFKKNPIDEDVDPGGDYMGRAGVWEMLVLSSRFCCEPKRAVKMKS